MLDNIRAFIRKYFGFSESETNGFIIMIPMMILILIAPKVFKTILINYGENTNLKEDILLKEWIAEIDSKLSIIEEKPLKIKEFKFNPNTISNNEMIALGLTEKTATRIEKYRSAGGTFKSKKDLLKIYGISKDRVKELLAFIIIPPPKVKFAKGYPKKKKSTFKKLKKKFFSYELNKVSADSLTNISGIGPVLSERIVKFRNNLGGFISINQLNEVYGLEEKVIEEIGKNTTLDSLLIEPVDINNDSIKHISRHPYISFKLAKIIVAYKKQHGPYVEVEEIKNIKIVSDTLFMKLEPYLKANNY